MSATTLRLPSKSDLAQRLAHTLGWESVWVVMTLRRHRRTPFHASDWHLAQSSLSRSLLRESYGSDTRSWPAAVRDTIRHTVRRCLDISPIPAS